MAIIEIKEGDLILARHISGDHAWGGGLSFFSNNEDYVQVGTWGYDKGKLLLPHTHNEVPRTIILTQEVLYVRKGRIKAMIFNSCEQLVAEFEVVAGDIVALLHGGHGYEILDDDTQVLEVKNGPYVGADLDRRRL